MSMSHPQRPMKLILRTQFAGKTVEQEFACTVIEWEMEHNSYMSGPSKVIAEVLPPSRDSIKEAMESRLKSEGFLGTAREFRKTYEWSNISAPGAQVEKYINTKAGDVKVYWSNESPSKNKEIEKVLQLGTQAYEMGLAVVSPLTTSGEDYIDIPEEWMAKNENLRQMVQSVNGTVMSLATANAEQLAELVRAGQQQLKGYDDQLAKFAGSLSENPTHSDKIIPLIREAYKQQVLTEKRIEVFATEVEKRNKEVNRKNWLRSDDVMNLGISALTANTQSENTGV